MKKVPVEVTAISGSAPYQGYVVIVKEKDGSRLLPIFIGVAEAHNIHLLRTGLKYVRPLTYDLFHSILEKAEAQISEVVITELRDNTFYAKVNISIRNGVTESVDARPSDAIALAIKTKAPIFVSSDVLDEAGLIGGSEATVEDLSGMETSDKIDLLNQQLSTAVEQEAYETAAKIRDQIKELESKDNLR